MGAKAGVQKASPRYPSGPPTPLFVPTGSSCLAWPGPSCPQTWSQAWTASCEALPRRVRDGGPWITFRSLVASPKPQHAQAALFTLGFLCSPSIFLYVPVSLGIHVLAVLPTFLCPLCAPSGAASHCVPPLKTSALPSACPPNTFLPPISLSYIPTHPEVSGFSVLLLRVSTIPPEPRSSHIPYGGHPSPAGSFSPILCPPARSQVPRVSSAASASCTQVSSPTWFCWTQP